MQNNDNNIGSSMTGFHEALEQMPVKEDLMENEEGSLEGFFDKEIIPMLPQNDPKPGDRKDYLDKNRAQYEYEYEYLEPLAMLESLPKQENFSYKYLTGRLASTLKIKANLLDWKAKTIFDPFDHLDDFDKMFPLLPTPAILKTWKTDEAFGNQQLAGSNPMKMIRITHVSQMPFKVNPSDMTATVPGYDTIEDAISAGILYMSDYTNLSSKEFGNGGNYGGITKYLPTPKVLFYWTKSNSVDKGHLMPAAIQAVQDGPIYTPLNSSPTDWLIAKLAVQIANANHHEMASHLCETHFVMEPFAVTTARQLAENHPIGILLRPHFRFMLVNNDFGRKVLVNTGGIIDELLSGTIEYSLGITQKSYTEWDFKENSFNQSIQNREMYDPTVLPEFPYRDDGMLLWGAIKKFMTAYVNVYYHNAADLSNDKEIQAWAGELASQNGGRISGMPSKIETNEQLIDILTNILFTCGPQHGAVNFSQYDYMTHAPNMPTAAYCPVPTKGTVSSENDLMAFLPPRERAAKQLEIAASLGLYHYDRLGFYDKDTFSDERVKLLVQQFQEDLAVIEEKIILRNNNRVFEYRFLKPSEILNSISI